MASIHSQGSHPITCLLVVHLAGAFAPFSWVNEPSAQRLGPRRRPIDCSARRSWWPSAGKRHSNNLKDGHLTAP
jgi:hypothetical protein